MTRRSMIVRGVLAAAYVALAVWAFGAGKGYKVFVDNTDMSVAGAVTVAIDGATPVKVRQGGFTGIMVKGTGTHKVKIVREGSPDFIGEFKFPPKADAVAIAVSGIKPGAEIAVVPVPADTTDR